MTQRTVVRFFLLGLPIGLAISVVIGLWVYYNPIQIPKFRGNTQHMAADARRKAPEAGDIADYRRILTTDLARRPATDLPALRRTADWVAGTLGPTNAGFTVERREVPLEGGKAENLFIEVKGRRSPAQALVVTTGYDSTAPGLDSDSAVAVLMSLSTAFVGTPQQRTVIFAFTAPDTAATDGRSGPVHLLDDLRAGGRSIHGVLDLRVVRVPAPAPAARPDGPTLVSAAATADDPWRFQVQEALARRLPTGFATEWLSADTAPPELAALPWLGTPAPAPSLVMALRPPRPGDEPSLLAWAQALEGLVQALANR